MSEGADVGRCIGLGHSFGFGGLKDTTNLMLQLPSLEIEGTAKTSGTYFLTLAPPGPPVPHRAISKCILWTPRGAGVTR